MQLEEEGCLSVPGFNATVARPVARRPQGTRSRTASQQTVEASGLLARCFQHEMDHLDGTLFVDRLRGLQKDLIVRKIKKLAASRQMVAPVRIVFFGTPQFAVPTLEALIASRTPVVGVVTQPDRPRGRGQKVTDSPGQGRRARARVCPSSSRTRLRDPGAIDALSALSPDLGVVAAYGKLIPGDCCSYPASA